MTRSPRAANLSALILVGALLVGCSASTSASRSSSPTTATRSSASAPSAFPSILGENCAPLVKQAAANPDLLVDALPEPQRMEPSPIRRPVPPGVMKKDGSATLELTVLVDTSGRPVMHTFRTKSTHPWFTEGAREAVAKWRFSPAMLNGCRVPRNYHWRADAAPRSAGAAKGKAKGKS